MRRPSQKTLSRALIYIRSLERLIKAKQNLVSSRELAQLAGVTDVQVRKDISSFGKVGTPRVGYGTAELKHVLENFVLQRHVVHVVLFGVGNLGSAILKYPGFLTDKIRIVAAFDSDARKTGRKINGVPVYAPDKAASIVKRKHAQIGIVAVPQEQAQAVADIMVAAGLAGIVNFAPTLLSVPRHVRVKDIDFSIEFLSLFSEILRCKDCDAEFQEATA